MRSDIGHYCTALPAIGVDDITDAISRLPNRYFELFEFDAQIIHIDHLAALNTESPVSVIFRQDGELQVHCTIITYNYPFLFSLITGLLSSSHMEIVEGEIFTYSKQHTVSVGRIDRRRLHSQIKRRKVVDYFSGRLPSNIGFREWCADVTRGLHAVISQLEIGTDVAIREAGQIVVRRAATSISESGRTVQTQMSPIQITLDNSGTDVTELTLVAENTPFFLYSFGTALAHHGISIERLSIATNGTQVRDTFYLTDANGQKLQSDASLDQLRLSVLLCKQFTFFLDQAPNPFDAISRFEQFVTDILSRPEKADWVRLLSNPLAMKDMAKLLGTSDYIWEDFIRLHYESLLPILGPDTHNKPVYMGELTIQERLNSTLNRITDFGEIKRLINQFKDQEIYLIDLAHILGQSDIVTLSRQLTTLVESVITTAFTLVYNRLVMVYGTPNALGKLPATYAIFGLGKLGGAALGYASDIELMVVYSDNGVTSGKKSISNGDFFTEMLTEVRQLITAKRSGIFDIDLRLRPYGNDGPLGVSLENFCRYFAPEGPSHIYERVALVRLRYIGGDSKLGRRVETLRDEFVYSAAPNDFSELWQLRKKQYEEKALTRLNAKFSPGALVDLEYTVQAIQISAGQRHPEFRSPRIRETLAALGNAGILDPKEADRMGSAYLFLRELINGLRMLRGSAEDLFLPDDQSTEYDHLARRMGYQAKETISAASQLHMDFEATTATVRTFVETHFSRQSLPSNAVANVADLVINANIPPELQHKVVSKYGFRDTNRAVVNLVRLSSADRDHVHFPRLVVLACEWLRQKSDPDMALNNWERLVAQLPEPSQHFSQLLSQPVRLDILLDVFSVSQFLSDSIIRHPYFFEDVIASDRLHHELTPDDLAERLRLVSAGTEDSLSWRNALRRFKTREILRIAIKDISLQVAMPEIYYEISLVAEAIIYQSIERSFRRTPGLEPLLGRFCLLAMGKLGGTELNYSSDIDIIPIIDWNGMSTTDIATLTPLCEGALRQFSDDLSIFTEEGQAYRVDFTLRPFGRAGQWLTPVSALIDYYRQSASEWEIQALIKMKPVYGNARMGSWVMDALHTIAPTRFEPSRLVSHIRHLRQIAIRKSASRMGNGIDIKNGEGGIRDIEFWIQGLQLMAIGEHPELWIRGTLDALDQLRRLGIVGESVAVELRDIYLLFRRIEHFLQILDDQQTHTLPSNETALTVLAKRLLGPSATGVQLITTIDHFQSVVRSRCITGA